MEEVWEERLEGCVCETTVESRPRVQWAGGSAAPGATRERKGVCVLFPLPHRGLQTFSRDQAAGWVRR